MKLSDFIINSLGGSNAPELSEGMATAIHEVSTALAAASPDANLVDQDSLGNKITLNLKELLQSQYFREAVDSSIPPPQPEEDEDAFVARAMGGIERIFKDLI